MAFSTAPALLIGLGARILLDALNHKEASVRDFILVGAWQGVGLHYAFQINPTFALPVVFGIAVKLLIDFIVASDSSRCATTLVGVALGVLCTEFLSQFIDTPPPVPESEPERRRKKPHTPHATEPTSQRQRVVQFRRSVEGDTTATTETPRHLALMHTISDITSVDSTSDLVGRNSSMSPLDRDIAALRARASLADSERRRYREERKWAISQGNPARASQMKWQVTRYTALMQSFHREADAKIIEAATSKGHQVNKDGQRPLSSNDKQHRYHKDEIAQPLSAFDTNHSLKNKLAVKPSRDHVR